jgi:P4 family phage/plasmid primase-like protien
VTHYNFVPEAEISASLKDTMDAAGLVTADEIVIDGTIHRVHIAGDRKGTKNGWYVAHSDPPASGMFGCFKRDISHAWTLRAVGTMTEAERRAVACRMESARRDREALRQEQRRQAQVRAARIWSGAAPAPPRHPYLVRKHVQPHGIRVGGHGQLVVPLIDGEGTLWSVQFIAPTGCKLFLKHGAKRGRFAIIGDMLGSTAAVLVIVLCEGWATGATIHEATGLPIAVAFDAGNLEPVALAIRHKHPGAVLIIAADNDRWDAEVGNVGVIRAKAAAQAVGAVVAIPDLSGVPGQPTDFNDIGVFHGLDAVRDQINAAVSATNQRRAPSVGDAGDAPLNNKTDEAKSMEGDAGDAPLRNKEDGDAERGEPDDSAGGGNPIDVSLLVSMLPAKVRKALADPAPSDFGKTLFRLVRTLAKRGWPTPVIESVIRAHSNGIGAPWIGRDGLDDEVARIRAWSPKKSDPGPKDDRPDDQRDTDDNDHAEPWAPALEIGSDVELARLVSSRLRRTFGTTVYCDGAFWTYQSTHWKPHDEQALRLIVHEYDGAEYPGRSGEDSKVRLGKGRIDSVLHEMRAILSSPEFFAKAALGINCMTGFISFSPAGTPSLMPHDPEHRHRHVLAGSWPCTASDEVKSRSLLARLLGGCFQDDEDAQEKVNLLAEVAGAAALGYSTKLMKPKAVVLKGIKAENGKSQVLDMIRGLLPSEAIASLPPGRFGDDKYTVQLVGKLLNASDELTSASAISSDTFKQIVTGEPISSRDVYRSAVTFRPVAQHIFATNDLPAFKGGMDRGVQRRLLVIPFDRVIPVEERVECIGARIAAEEMGLLLDWAVEGARRLIPRRYFAELLSSKDALQDWLLITSPVLAWLAEATELVSGKDAKKIRSADAYRCFKEWALQEGHDENRIPKINSFVQRVTEADMGIVSKRDGLGRYLVGIRIKPVEERWGG